MDIKLYLELEQQLLGKLRKELNPKIREYRNAVADALAKGNEGAAYKVVRDLSVSDVSRRCKQHIRFMLAAFGAWGAGQAASGNPLLVHHHPEWAPTLDRLTKIFCLTLDRNLSAAMINSLTSAITSSLEEVQKADQPTKRYLRELVSFQEDSDAMLRLISGLHSSRIAVWGFTAEAEITGITEYKLTAVLDSRTSDFCRMINGKTFKVEDARRSIVQILESDNPDDVRILQPWPKQTKAALEEFRTLSAEELTARGLHIPPFHPGCRTVLVTVKQAQKLRVERPAFTPETKLTEYLATSDDFQALGVSLDEAQVEHWNRFLRVNPVSLLSRLSGLSGNDLMSGVRGKAYAPISITHDGDVRLRFKLPEYSNASVSTVYEPLSGTLFVEYLSFAKGYSATAAAVAVERLLLAVKETSVELGASNAVMEVSGTFALPLAQRGVAPVSEDWFSVSGKLKSLVEGDLSSMFALLTSSERQAVLDLLKSHDPKALVALANMRLTAEGRDFTALLFENLSFKGSVLEFAT